MLRPFRNSHNFVLCTKRHFKEFYEKCLAPPFFLGGNLTLIFQVAFASDTIIYKFKLLSL